MLLKYTRENNSSMPVSFSAKKKVLAAGCTFLSPLHPGHALSFPCVGKVRGKTPNAAAAPSLVIREEMCGTALISNDVVETALII